MMAATSPIDTTIDYALIAVLGIATLITFFMTMTRLFTHHRYISYDSWIFATCLALTLQVGDAIMEQG